MSTIQRPHTLTVELLASALLAALGLVGQAGCGSDVVINNQSSTSGGGGNGGMGSSTASSSSSTSTTSSSGVAGGGGTGTGECINPMPIIVNGIDTGVDICAGGQYLRREAVECPTNFPDTNPCCGTCPDGMICNTQGEIACTCTTACTNDSQCMPNELCLCGQTAGTCVPALCKTGADCPDGQSCTSWDTTLGCLYLQFACTTPADTCSGNADCSATPNLFCAVQADGHRECVPGGCAIGRPFFVDGEVRTAPVLVRGDWRCPTPKPSLDGIDESMRGELAEAWERTARMEHASIAAFARFSLQLLSLGAGPDLIERTNQAMVDETRHARMAFAISSAYRGTPVGPGPLLVDNALEGANDAASILRLCIREGCVGETVAAMEAGEAASHCEDSAVALLLTQIARDEATHAELAYRTLKWALSTLGEEIKHVLRDEIERIQVELSTSPHTWPSAHEMALLSYGVVIGGEQLIIRRKVLAEVVLPCLSALLSIEPAKQEAPALDASAS